jgi:hypothetical protein
MPDRMNITTETTAPLSSIPKGEPFRLKEGGRVYLKDGYCRDARRYLCGCADDISASRLIRGDKPVLVGFTY